MIRVNLGKYVIRFPQKNKLTKHDIHDKPYGIREVAREYHKIGLYNHPECYSIIYTMFKIMADTLAKHEKVSIAGFGEFHVGNRNNLSKNITVFFVPSKRLKANFNPDYPKYIREALQYKKDKTLDFSPENWRSTERKKTKRKQKSKITTVDAKDVDVFKIVERLTGVPSEELSKQKKEE